MVTVEAALAAGSLCLVAVLLSGIFTVVAAQLRVGDAARTAARAAALGAGDAQAQALSVAPGADVSIERDGSVVTVRVSRSVPLLGLTPMRVSSVAEVVDEVGALEAAP